MSAASEIGKFKDQLNDVCKWYYHHCQTIPPENLHKRLEFQEVAIRNLINLMITLLEIEIEHVNGNKNLLLPSHVDVSGDIRRFG